MNSHVDHLDSAHAQLADTVIGALPIPLAAAVRQQGARFFNLSLSLHADWRGRELSACELRQCNARLEGFADRPLPQTLAQQVG